MGACDRDLVVLGVAVERDDLHPVQQGVRDRVRDVGRGQEQHVGEVEVDLEVVVAEGVVLRRVQHLEQRRGRVAPVVRAHLVDLVEQHDRVHRAGLGDGADDAPRQGTDVGAPVPADLGLVAHAAERDAHELPAQGARHRLPQRGLADAGRPDEGEHRSGPAAADDLEPALGAPGADGEVLHDPLLDVVEPVVVGVEHLAGAHDVGGVLGAHRPRQLEHGVQPGADPARLRALVAGPLELADLAQRRLAHGVRQVCCFDAAPVVLGAVGLVLAQLAADRGQLLAQQELPLALVHPLADVVADLLGDLELGEVVARPGQHERQPAGDVGGLEQLALLLVTEVRRVAGQVGQLGGVGDPLHGVDHLPGVAALQDRDDDLAVVLGQRAHLVGDLLVLDGLGLHPQRGAGARHSRTQPGPSARAQHRGGSATGEAADLLDGGDDAVRRVAVGEPGREQQPVLGGGARRVDDGPGVGVELDRHHHPGQHDGVRDRQQRQGDGFGHGVLDS